MTPSLHDDQPPSDDPVSGTHGFLHRIGVQLGLLDDMPKEDEVAALRRRLTSLEGRLGQAEARIADLERER